MTLNSWLIPKHAEQIVIPGPAGSLDTLVLKPKSTIRGVAIIFHPDPKGGGSNTNKIVQTVAKVANAKGYIAYCPNLRGVGQSSGTHDFGQGELADAKAIYQELQREYSDLPLLLAGFSFGTSIASQLAFEVTHEQLVLIGPAVSRYRVLVPNPTTTVVIHGQEDEVISLEDVFSWSQPLGIPVTVFTQTGHFFHGKLVQLQNYLMQVLK